MLTVTSLSQAELRTSSSPLSFALPRAVFQLRRLRVHNNHHDHNPPDMIWDLGLTPVYCQPGRIPTVVHPDRGVRKKEAQLERPGSQDKESLQDYYSHSALLFSCARTTTDFQ